MENNNLKVPQECKVVADEITINKKCVYSMCDFQLIRKSER